MTRTYDDPAPGDFDALNSATKYPSIPAYHTLDPKNGNLSEPTVPFHPGPVVLTEKVDGAGSRIILLPDGDFVIGSREELLYARGDRIVNPAQGIVPALNLIAERLARRRRALESIATAHGDITGFPDSPGDGVIWVWYLETYGAAVRNPAVKQYTSAGATGVRLFDVAGIDTAVLDQSPEQIAGWRAHHGQSFLSEDVLPEAAADAGVELTPRLGTIDAGDLPQDLAVTLTVLHEYLPVTRAALDDGAGRQAEGIVLRDVHRRVTAKAKFRDYERTLRKRKGELK